MWDQLYPTLIACVEYMAYEFRKSFQLTSPHNNHWFIVLEKWNNRFSLLGQSLRGFIGFFHSSNNFALFWFHSTVYTTKLFSWSSFSIIHKKNKKYFPFLLVTLYRQIPGPGQARALLTTVAWNSECYVRRLFSLSSRSMLRIISCSLFFFFKQGSFPFFIFPPQCPVSAHEESFKIKGWTSTTRGYAYYLFFSFLRAFPPSLFTTE